jgi:hypothetical protein
VYELAAEHAIPVSRVTGKPVPARDGRARCGSTPSMRAASRRCTGARRCSPAATILLEWALRQSGSELAAFFDGSLTARRPAAIAAGLHVRARGRGLEPRPRRARHGGLLVVLIEAWRVQDWWPAGNPNCIARLGDLEGRTDPRQERSHISARLSPARGGAHAPGSSC